MPEIGLDLHNSLQPFTISTGMSTNNRCISPQMLCPSHRLLLRSKLTVAPQTTLIQGMSVDVF